MSLKSFLISFRQSSVWLCLMSLCLTVGSCSSVERTVRRAEAAEAIGEHLEAANLYRMAYRATPTKERSRRGLLAFRMGEACHRHGNSARALGAYRRPSDMASPTLSPTSDSDSTRLLPATIRLPKPIFPNILPSIPTTSSPKPD